MSVIMMATTLAAVGLRISNVVALSKFNPADVAPGSDAFGSHFARLQGTAARVRVERSLMALLSFCVWLRVFKYTRRVPVFGTIGRTMTRAFPAVRPLTLLSASHPCRALHLMAFKRAARKRGAHKQAILRFGSPGCCMGTPPHSTRSRHAVEA
jgi:hypothetical protein